jgi:hypothetical protein
VNDLTADNIEDGYCFGCDAHCGESQFYHCCKTFFCDGCAEEEPSHDRHAPSAHLSKLIQSERAAELEDVW